ncbi:MAG: hypothetical protein ACLQF0_05420 [Dissulfurispiraceae bacterium]
MSEINTTQRKIHRAVIITVLVIGLPAFVAGWVVAVNFSGVFETGYKMAFIDIKSSIGEAHRGSQPYFFMNGIRFYVDGSIPDKILPSAEVSVAFNEPAKTSAAGGDHTDGYCGNSQQETVPGLITAASEGKKGESKGDICAR